MKSPKTTVAILDLLQELSSEEKARRRAISSVAPFEREAGAYTPITRTDFPAGPVSVTAHILPDLWATGSLYGILASQIKEQPPPDLRD